VKETRCRTQAVSPNEATPRRSACRKHGCDCKQLNAHRFKQTEGERRLVPAIAYNIYKSKFEQPSVNDEEHLSLVQRIAIDWVKVLNQA
jgi:hypothetical protein